jgi:hypothetical protein
MIHTTRVWQLVEIDFKGFKSIVLPGGSRCYVLTIADHFTGYARRSSS